MLALEDYAKLKVFFIDNSFTLICMEWVKLITVTFLRFYDILLVILKCWEWGKSSLGDVLASYRWTPEFKLWNPCKMPNVVVYAYHTRVVVEVRGYLGLDYQSV